jgi:hypothetical protein
MGGSLPPRAPPLMCAGRMSLNKPRPVRSETRIEVRSVNSIARDLEAFRHALRDVDLDEREVNELVDIASTRSLTSVEVICSLFEKVRQAGYLKRVSESEDSAQQDEFVRKEPGDWGWATSSGGSTYMGRNGDDADPDGPTHRLDRP